MNLALLDEACAAHLQHGAMALDDPLTTAVCEQCCAPEGAQPYSTAGAGLTPAQRAALAESERFGALLWLMPLAVAAGAVLSAVWPWGVA